MPPRRSFLLKDERGGFTAWELWRYAKALGMSPRRALSDPELGFNLSVMRGHDVFRRERLRALPKLVEKKKDIGIGLIVQLLARVCDVLRLIYEDG